MLRCGHTESYKHIKMAYEMSCRLLNEAHPDSLNSLRTYIVVMQRVGQILKVLPTLKNAEKCIRALDLTAELRESALGVIHDLKRQVSHSTPGMRSVTGAQGKRRKRGKRKR
jgi:hypothetical protein